MGWIGKFIFNRKNILSNHVNLKECQGQTKNHIIDKSAAFNVGDSVKVKANTQDPDLGGDISGWIGRILEIEDQMVTIQWDSITLSKMPDSMIMICEQEGWDWSEMCLPLTEVERVDQRDTVADVNNIVNQIQLKHDWDDFDEEGVIIRSVLKGIDSEDYDSMFDSWLKYLKKAIKIPFHAEVSEFQERGSLSQGDDVKVLEFSDIDGRHGILVKISCNRNVHYFPLCDLKVKNKKSPNYDPIKAYAVWFANN